MFSGSQLKGSAFTRSLLITELLEREPEIPLRPATKHTRACTQTGEHQTAFTESFIFSFSLSRLLTGVEELRVEHGHVVPTSCLNRK